MKIIFSLLSLVSSLGLLISIFVWIDPEIVANLLFMNSYLPAMLVISMFAAQIVFLLTNSPTKTICYTVILVLNLYLFVWRAWNPLFLLISVIVFIFCWWLSRLRSDKVVRSITSSSESGGKDEETR